MSKRYACIPPDGDGLPLSLLHWCVPSPFSMNDLVTCRPIRLKYFLAVPNVGDRASPEIVSAVSGQPTVRFTRIHDPHLLAVGSLMAMATPQSRIWGTGVMHPDFGTGSPLTENIYALRGKLTHTALRNAGIEVPDVPLGDPGYLMPTLAGIGKSDVPRYRLGVVPHLVDRGNQSLKRLLSEADVADLDVHNDPDHFLRTMAECEAVISTSLHGLVFAEALQIPNLWVTVSDGILGGAFKFNDWFSTTAAPQSKACPVTVNDTVDNLISRAELHDSTIDVEALQAALSIDRLEELRETEARPIVPTRACRVRPVPVFVVSYDRGGMLEEVIESIRRLDRPTEIVVHDCGNTDSEMLAKLETTGIRTVQHQSSNTPDHTNNVDMTVTRFFARWSEPSRYIVCNCNVLPAKPARDAIDVYDELLNTFVRVACVGPLLRIRNGETSGVADREDANREIAQFWRNEPRHIETKYGSVAYVETMVDGAIDYEFALHRAGQPYSRFRHAVRVCQPYDAEVVSGPYSSVRKRKAEYWTPPYREGFRAPALLKSDYRPFGRNGTAGDGEIHKEGIPARMRPNDVHEPLAWSVSLRSERDEQLRWIEALRSVGGTDLERWRNPATHGKKWRSRSRALVRFVRAHESVFEFGAGNSIVARLLPEGCTYTGSDVAPLRADIMLLDLNAPVLRPHVFADVAFLSGVLEYVHNLERLVTFLSKHFRSVVCSYAPLISEEPWQIRRRRRSGWFNELSREEFEILFQKRGFCASVHHEWRDQLLYRWDI